MSSTSNKPNSVDRTLRRLCLTPVTRTPPRRFRADHADRSQNIKLMTKASPLLCFFVALIAGCVPSTKTIVKTGEAARSRITATGVTLPASASNLYYAHQPQFSDTLDTWISFSADSAECMVAAKAVAGGKAIAPVFTPGTRSKSEAVTGGPAYHHAEYATRLWDLSTVKNGTMLETKGLFVLVDLDAHRVYISLRAP
jgi:hypothetical protein